MHCIFSTQTLSVRVFLQNPHESEKDWALPPVHYWWFHHHKKRINVISTLCQLNPSKNSYLAPKDFKECKFVKTFEELNLSTFLYIPSKRIYTSLVKIFFPNLHLTDRILQREVRKHMINLSRRIWINRVLELGDKTNKYKYIIIAYSLMKEPTPFIPYPFIVGYINPKSRLIYYVINHILFPQKRKFQSLNPSWYRNSMVDRRQIQGKMDTTSNWLLDIEKERRCTPSIWKSSHKVFGRNKIRLWRWRFQGRNNYNRKFCLTLNEVRVGKWKDRQKCTTKWEEKESQKSENTYRNRKLRQFPINTHNQIFLENQKWKNICNQWQDRLHSMPLHPWPNQTTTWPILLLWSWWKIISLKSLLISYFLLCKLSFKHFPFVYFQFNNFPFCNLNFLVIIWVLVFPFPYLYI